MIDHRNDENTRENDKIRRLLTPRDGVIVRLALGFALGASACSGGDTGANFEPTEVLDGSATELEAEAGGVPGEAPETPLEAIEEPLDAELAFDIAEWKLAELGLERAALDIEKHAGCGTAGPTGKSVRNDDAPSNGAANQRSGSSTGCVALGVLQPTDDALYFCFTSANDGFTWTYAQNLRTSVRGWTRDDLLDDFGSFNFCGF